MVTVAINRPSGLGRTGINRPEALVQTATGSGVAHWVRVINCWADFSVYWPRLSSSGVTPHRPVPTEPLAALQMKETLFSGKKRLEVIAPAAFSWP